MALCGFNEKMLKGLSAFNEWLVEYGLMEGSKRNGESLDQAIRREISDMTRLLSEIHRIDHAGKRILTEWLVKYALWFYLLARERDVETYQELVAHVGHYFSFMDVTYYGELEWKARDMADLARFLNEKNCW